MEDKNLTQQIEALPKELVAAISQLKTAAQAKRCRLYLVGGAVRDLLLGLPARDVDIVVMGSAISLAEALSYSTGKLTLHPTFGTATIAFSGFRIDLSSARSERYSHPGALPTVRHGTLDDDLRRRDFTINAMAISLNENDYGHLIDHCGGQADLEAHLIRTLHAKSFSDDPSRIWRAVRYEQRLSFNIEPETLNWLKRDLAELKNITGDRLWYELACTLEEDEPEKTLTRLGELGALAQLHPSIRADGWLTEKFQAVRARGCPSLPIYLALLAYRLKDDETDICIGFLHLSNHLRRILQDTHAVKTKLMGLSRPGLKPSTVYHQLHGHTTESLEANLVACTSPEARRNITLYQDKLRTIKTSLTGDDIIKLGAPSGPRVGELMRVLLKARLDGQVKNSADELALAKSLIAG